MALKTDNERPVRLWLLIAFVVGVLAGWWGIGWGLWPVTWNNAYPQDLRAAERDHYLVMVAESYAATGNLPQARERLSVWPTEQLAKDMATLKGHLTVENARQAGQVDQLIGALGLAAKAPVIAAPTATPQPRPTPSQQPGRPLWQSVCIAGVFVLLVLAGIVGVIWLWNRWRASQMAQPRPAIPDAAARGERPRPLFGRTPTQIAEYEKGGWPGGEPAAGGLPPQEDAEPDAFDAEPLVGQRPATMPGSETLEEEELGEPELPSFMRRREPAGPPVQPAPTGPLVRLGEYRALFQMGEADYDESFDITDSTGAYIGQCGLELTDPVGRAHDQAAALQVWLWDTNDPDTRVKVLMSEGAYRDTAMRDQLAGEHQALQVKPGLTFELESHKLLLRGSVDKLEYADQEPVNGIFAELLVRLQVHRKGS